MQTATGNAWIAGVVLAALAACTPNVRSDSAKVSDVSACRTFGWAESTPGQADAFGNPINERRLREAVSQQLARHGIAPTAQGEGDCQVAVAYGGRQDSKRSRWSFGLGTGWGGGWGRSGSGGSVSVGTAPSGSRENSVSVDLFRPGGPAGREPVWHASVAMDLTRLSGAEAEKRIDDAVAAMFARFPGGSAGTPNAR